MGVATGKCHIVGPVSKSLTIFFFLSHHANNSPDRVIQIFNLENSQVHVMGEAKEQSHIVDPVSTSRSFYVKQTKFLLRYGQKSVWPWENNISEF